jgi:hypothetical protein
MVSNNAGKPSDTQRLPSTVPNDYDHLGVPGSLDIPLATSRRGREGRARRRVQARQKRGLPNWAKALLAIGGALFAFGVVGLVIFIIAFPPFFRDLEPRYQQRIIGYFPPATYWMPTRPFEQLPTLGGAGDSSEAQQLLLTQQAPPTDPPALVEPVLSSTPVPTLTPADTESDDGGIPVGMADTPVPTPLPVLDTPAQAAEVVPTWTPIVQPTQVPLPGRVWLEGIRYEQQGWNNCGPTTMTMALSFYGWTNNQQTAAHWMKPHPEDKNVSPWQMVRFVNENTNVRALYRYGGTTQLIKRLLAARFPVVVEESIQPAGEGWMGHYTLLMGYDETLQQFLAFDSYLGSNQGQGKPLAYSVFDDSWRHFNRVFMVVYEPSRETLLREVLGEYVDPNYGYKIALETARAEAAKNMEDKWAWFNVGTSYVALGEYENAAIAFDQSLAFGLPFRMLWYQFGPFEAYFYTGRYNDVLAMANANLGSTKYVEETYYWQGMVYAAQGDTQNAIYKFNEALKYNSNFFPAQEAKAQVEAGTFQVASAH